MSCEKVAKAITRALQTTEVVASDTFALVRDNTLYGVTFANIQDSLGVTGTITSDGAGDRVDILSQPIAGENIIRGIESGSGILAQISPENGVLISTQLANASTGGAEIIKDPTASTIELKRLTAGNQVTITDSDDSIEISVTSEAGGSNTVVVSDMSDFPAPVNGVITLEPKKDYLVISDLTTSNTFNIAQSISMRGAAPQVSSITYTGTGAMFNSSVDPNFKCQQILISAPNGSIVDIDSPLGIGVFQFRESVIFGCNSLGAVNDFGTFRMEGNALLNIAGGLTMTGNFNFGILANSIITTTAPTLYDLGSSTFDNLRISTSQITAAGAGPYTFLSGVTGSGNINAGGAASVQTVNFTGNITPLNNITAEDAGWYFANVTGVEDSKTIGFCYLSTPTVTTISSVSTPVKVVGVFNQEQQSRTTVSVDGRITYNTPKPEKVTINANLSINPVGGTNIDINIYIAKNGSVLPGSLVIAEISASNPKNQSVRWVDSAEEGDYYEVFVSNEQNTNDIQVNTLAFEVA